MKKNRDSKPKRRQWLVQLVQENQFTLGAEIGCNTGATTLRLLRFCPALTLYAVDHWEPIVEEGGGMAGRDGEKARRQFVHNTHLFRDRLRVLRGGSLEMSEQMKDGILDFVFIDADHRYETVLADIRAWAPKVKQGGIICGHDYNQPNFPGVAQAVRECFGENHNEVGVDYVWCAKRKDYVV